MGWWFEQYGLTESAVLLIFLCIRILLRATSSRNPAGGGTANILPPGVTTMLATDRREKRLYHHVVSAVDPENATHCILLCHGFAQSSSAWLKTATDVVPTLVLEYVCCSITHNYC